MATGFAYDETFLLHRPAGGGLHPECPERLTAILEKLTSSGLRDRLEAVGCREATRAELEDVHSPAYLDHLERVLVGAGHLDADTYFCEETRRAAWLAAGSAAELALRAASGELDSGVALVRPPGHHATRDRAMGFCFLNNVAVAARAVQRRGLATRVLIFDWDVHHGNGTENIFWDDPSVLYVSIHESPSYPGTGPLTARGGPNAHGANLNIPLPAGSTDADYLAVFEHVITPAWRRFAPDFVLLSAGYDAWARDPLADMSVTRRGFATLASRSLAMSGAKRVAAVLEGGYDRDALGDFLCDLVRVMLGDDAGQQPGSDPPSAACRRVIAEARAIHGIPTQ